MRIPLVTLSVFILLSVLSDVYIYKCIIYRLKGKIWKKLHLWSSLALYVMVIIAIALPRKAGDNQLLLSVMWMLYTFITVYFAKYVFVLIDLLGRIPVLFKGHRSKLVSSLALLSGIFTFLVLWWGALVCRYQIDVNDVEISREELPKAFDGYKIVQFSDLHSGTFGNDTSFVARLVDTINATNPDLIVFTGDIVNSRSDELPPHVAALSRLKAKDGVYSILGNHDYGDYSSWPTPEDKVRNLEFLKQLQSKMGWKMLNNETSYINRGQDSIAIIGVENIGDHPFPIYGSLTKAYPTLSDSTFKLLLTHNPAHWVDSISGHPDIHVPLTLSGHTHAMQIKFGEHSPASLRYKTWGGLYADADSSHMLYVNIGAGTVGMPARIGATPEITVIKLKSKN